MSSAGKIWILQRLGRSTQRSHVEIGCVGPKSADAVDNSKTRHKVCRSNGVKMGPLLLLTGIRSTDVPGLTAKINEVFVPRLPHRHFSLTLDMKNIACTKKRFVSVEPYGYNKCCCWSSNQFHLDILLRVAACH